jgi:hypothetical protein
MTVGYDLPFPDFSTAKMRVAVRMFHFATHVALSNIEYHKGNVNRW